jgi:hypothetical protein
MDKHTQANKQGTKQTHTKKSMFRNNRISVLVVLVLVFKAKALS